MRSAFGGMVITLLLGTTALAQTYQCEFLQEKRPHGKTNVATCTASPEAYFSVGSYIPPRDALCDVSGLPINDEYVNFIADLKKKMVTYTEVETFPRYKWEAQAEYEAQHDKIPLEEARKRIASESAQPIQHQFSLPIMNTLVSVQTDYFSKTTGAPVKDTKNPNIRGVQIIQYGNGGGYLLYVPVEGGPAAIVSYDLAGRYSAVNMRFGNCTEAK